MNRIAHLFDSIDDLLECAEPDPAAAGLRVQRAPLILLVRSALGELHERRRLATDPDRGVDLDWNIRYWEEVLTWLKGQEGRFLDMFTGLE